DDPRNKHRGTAARVLPRRCERHAGCAGVEDGDWMADLPFRPRALTPLACAPVAKQMPFDECRYDSARGADPQVSIFGFTTGGSVSSDRVSATRRIAAPAEKLFQIV